MMNRKTVFLTAVILLIAVPCFAVSIRLKTSCPYYTPGVTPQEAFDNYFYARGYLKTGGNASNGGVALWAQNGEFTHASIRKNTRSMYPHGYDWESKIGYSSPRIFHERDALRGNLYGVIVKYYKPNPNMVVNALPAENPAFSDKIKKAMKQRLRIIAHDKLYQNLQLYYNDWTDFCIKSEKASLGNPDYLKEDISFETLLKNCKEEQQIALLLICEKLLEHDIKAGFLLDEMIPEELTEIRKKSFHYVKEGLREMPTMMGNYYRLAEAYYDCLF